MLRQSLFSLVTGCTLAAISLTAIGTAKADDSVRFICASGLDQQTKQYHPTTYASTSRGNILIIRWTDKWFKNSEITPEFRCREVSKRFQKAYDEKSLKYITLGKENDQTVICTAREDGGTCVTTLLTLRPEDDAKLMAARLKKLLRGQGDGRPIQNSGGEQQVYYEIDIEQFLQTAPVEKE
jgi:hypothetical protein